MFTGLKKMLTLFKLSLLLFIYFLLFFFNVKVKLLSDSRVITFLVLEV